LEIKELFHPFIDQPVCNDIGFSDKNNLIFITGPNLAGKSTFNLKEGITNTRLGMLIINKEKIIETIAQIQ
jgi:dsDNA-specific endonuclease/ATPase MutS2